MADNVQVIGLDAFFNKLDNLSTREVEVRAAKAVHSLTIERFETGTDPTGAQWANLSTGERSFLFETGELQSTTRIDATGPDVTVLVGDEIADYAFFHQEGTINMPQRQILPDGDNLPAEYTQRINDYVMGYIKEIL